MTEMSDEQILEIIKKDDKLLMQIQRQHEKNLYGGHHHRERIPKETREKYGRKTGSQKYYSGEGQADLITRLIKERIDRDGVTATKRIKLKNGAYKATTLEDYSDKQYEIYCWAAELIYDVLEQIGKCGTTYRDKNGALVSEKGVVLVDSWDEVTADYHIMEEGRT